MERHSRALLFTLVFSLAFGDWMLAHTTAQGGDGRRGALDAAAPTQIPAMAYLTGPVAREADVDGIRVTLDSAPESAFTLVFQNESDESKTIELEVDCLRRVVNPLARLLLPAELMHTEHIRVSIPAHATIRRALSVARPATMTAQAPTGLTVSTTMTFALRDTGAEGEGILATLRWSSAGSEAG